MTEPKRTNAEEKRRELIQTGAALALHPRLARARDSFERLLLAVAHPSEVRLGGGTVLAAPNITRPRLLVQTTSRDKD